MSLTMEYLRGAEAEVLDIFAYLEDVREGAGIEFTLALDAHLVRLANFPEMAPRYIEEVRRLVMIRYPYGIFYHIQAHRILIVAVLDLRQDQERIRRRLSGA